MASSKISEKVVDKLEAKVNAFLAGPSAETVCTKISYA